MDSIERILTYPTEGDDWPRTILIGGVLTFLGFLVVPLFLVYGYAVRVISETLDGSTEPPAFDDWEALFVDGLKAWLISVVYMLVPALVALGTVGTAIFSLVIDPSPAAMGGLFFGVLVSGILGILFGYVAAAAVVNFSRERRLGAAFEFGLLKQVLLRREFALAWLVTIAGFVGAGIVGSVPFVGWILAPFASFYVVVAAGYLLARGFDDALTPAEGIESTSDGRPTA